MATRRTPLGAGLVLLLVFVSVVFWFLTRPDAEAGAPAAPTRVPEGAAPAAFHAEPLPERAPLQPLSDATVDALVEAPAALADGAPGPGERQLGLTGRVLDTRQRPVPGARVEFLSRAESRANVLLSAPAHPRDVLATATSGADGRFHLAALESRSFVPAGSKEDAPLLRVWAAGFAVQVQPAEAGGAGDAGDAGDTDLGDIVLADGAAVRGRLQTTAGLPVADALVEAARENAEGQSNTLARAAREAESARTGADGAFVLAGLRPGTLAITATGPGWPPYTEEEFELQPGEVLDLGAFVLPSGHGLSGSVRDANGPLAGAAVSARRPGQPAILPRPRATTDADGGFSLQGLTAGAWTVLAEAEGHYPAEVTLELPTPQAAELLLQPLRSLIVRARDADGELVRGGFVRLHAGNQVCARAEFEGGEAALSLPRDGRILIVADGCAPRVLEVKLKELGLVQEGKVKLDREARVFGRVRDRAGQLQPGLLVRALPWAETEPQGVGFEATAVTDAQGAYELRGLGAGEWSVRVDRPGYRTGRFGATLAAGEVKQLDLQLVAGGVLEGRVVTTRGTPRVRAEVAVSQGGRTTRTDTEGRFVFSGLPAGELRVSVTDTPLRETFTIADDTTTQVELVVPETGAVSGRVRSGSRELEGLTVKLSGHGPKSFTGITDARGEFRIEGLMPGTWTLTVRTDDALPRVTTEVLLADGQEARLELDLSGAAVRVLVRRAEDGTPLPDADVALRQYDPQAEADASPWAFGRRSAGTGERDTGPDGSVSFSDVPPGLYRAEVEADGRRIVRQEVQVRDEAGEQLVTVDLAPAARVSGRLVAADGGTLPVRLLAYHPAADGGVEDTHAVNFSARDGSFHIDHLPGGPLRLSVMQSRDGLGLTGAVELLSMALVVEEGETSTTELRVQPLRQP